MSGSGMVVNSQDNLRRTEVEIERSRETENWERVQELAEALRSKTDRNFAILADFLIGEAKLEGFLKKITQFPNSKITTSPPELLEAKNSLMKTVGEEAKNLGVRLDSYILLGKLYFALGNYSEALGYYERAQIDTLEEKQLPPRSLKILAEAFAIKAMSMEKTADFSGNAVSGSSGGGGGSAAFAERQSGIIRCFEAASDLTLLYLQVADRTTSFGQSTWSVASAGTSGSTSPTEAPASAAAADSRPKIGPLLELSLYKAAALNIQQGKPLKAVTRLRNMLMAEESNSTKEIRRNVCCQLAELLLSNCSSAKYQRPEVDVAAAAAATSSGGSGRSQQQLTRTSGSSSGGGTWKPMKHCGYNLFSPKTKYEELVLILLLSENIANKGAVLSQGPSSATGRKATFEAATVTYDLLTLSLARMENFRLLTDMLERSMKFSFQEKHTWEQFAFVLNVEGKHYRSLMVARDMASRMPMDAGTCLSTARLCYEKLALFEEGTEWARKALLTDAAKSNRHLESRCLVYAGIGCLLSSTTTKENLGEKRKRVEQAGDLFRTALAKDDRDHFVEFYLAYYYAQSRQIKDALQHVRNALQLHPFHQPSLHLMILLLTSNQEYEEAFSLAEQAIEEFPDNIELRSLKIKLEEFVLGPAVALASAKELMMYWQTMVEEHHLGLDEGGLVGGGSGGAGNAGNEGGNAGYSMTHHGYSGHHHHHNNAPSVSSYGLSQSVASGIGGPGMTNSTVAGNMADTYSDAGDSMSFHAQSVAASQVERAFSEIGSLLSTGGQFNRIGGGAGGSSGAAGKDPTYCLMRIWLVIAELHLGQGDLESAEFCVMEAKQLAPHAYHVTSIRGLVEEAKGNYEEARQLFEDALAINPFHATNTFHLARIHYHLRHYRLAYTSVKMALRIDPYNEDYWSFMGCVFDTLYKEFQEEAALFGFDERGGCGGDQASGTAAANGGGSFGDESGDEETDRSSASDLHNPRRGGGGHNRNLSNHLSPKNERPGGLSSALYDNFFMSSADNDVLDTLRAETKCEDLDSLSNEMSKKAERAAECHSIALSLINTGPILPFNTISVAYD